jgi:hypothetical protein
MRHAKSPAVTCHEQSSQPSKKKERPSGEHIEDEGRLELLRYAAPVGLIPSWADM